METYYILARGIFGGHNLVLNVVQGEAAAFEQLRYWKELGYAPKAWDLPIVPAWALNQWEERAREKARMKAVRENYAERLALLEKLNKQ